MNNENKFLLPILGIATLLTVAFVSYSFWQTARLDRIKKDLRKEAVMQKLRVQAMDSQIDRLSKNSSFSGFTSTKNTTTLYRFIATIASDHQLRIVRINLNPDNAVGSGETPPMEIVLSGSYQHAADFLADFRQLDKLEVTKMDLTVDSEDPTQSLRLTLAFKLPLISEVRP